MDARTTTLTPRRRRTCLVASVAILAVLATACGSDDGDDGDDGASSGDGGKASSFNLGFSAPFSGPFSSLGNVEAEGAKIAVAELDSKFDDTPVKFKTYDDKNDPAAAVAVAQEAIQRDKLSMQIGPVFTGTAAATMQTYTNGKLPQFIVGSAQSVIGPQFPYAFRLTYPSSYQAQVLVGYGVGILKKQKLGILVVKDALGESEKKSATEELQKRGLKPVAVEEMNTGATDVTGQLQRIKKAGADSVYVYATGADAAVVAGGMDQIGLKVPVFGHTGFTVASFRKLTAGKDISQVYAATYCSFTTPQGEALAPKLAEFADKMKSGFYKGGDVTESMGLSGLMYDAVYVAREAFRKSGGKTDGDSLKDALKQVQYEGLMGKVDFSQGNEGWPIENVTVVKVDSFKNTNGTFDRAPDAICGVG